MVLMKTKPALLLIAVNIFINTNTTICAQAVNVQDSLALVDLYNSTHGTNWTNNNNWLTGPVVSWYGITVTGNSVTGIKLSSNNLTGNIPTTIGSLTNLKHLDLSFNNLSNNIPSEFGNLTNLQDADLSVNQLSGSIPASIGNLVALDSLQLFYNSLSGEIPSSFGNLVNLKVLSLGVNQLSGDIPSSFSSLTNLRTLDLSENYLSTIPSFIGDLVNLTFLNLFYSGLSGEIPSSIGNLVNLQRLILEWNHLSGVIPSSIGNLVNLRDLSLDGNQLSGAIPSSIGNLVNLQSLNLEGNQLTGNIPSSIGNLTNLETLWLDINQLSGNIPSSFSNLASMGQLILSDNQLSGNIPSFIGNLTNLYTLFLEGNQLSGNIPSSIGNLSNLSQLDLSKNQLSGSIPVSLTNLDFFYLNLADNKFIFDDLEPIAQKVTDGFYYAPQANIDLHQNDSSISVYAGGTLSKNTYRWFKVGNEGNTTIAGDSAFHPSERGSYYAQVTNSICIQLTLNTDTVEYLGTLPVTIINLKAYRQGKQNKIEWTSVTEMNVDRYEIQRSSNAPGFVTIGSARARGNGTQKTQYSFNDAKPLLGNNYYRLKIFDDDGKITYSNTVLVNINNIELNTLIYPVPANDILHVETNGNIPFSMLDQSGRILFTITINGKGAIDVSHFNAGMYFLKNNSTGDVQKVVVIR